MDKGNARAYIWDMDGVIVDSEPLHVRAEQETCRDFGAHAPEDEWKGFQGRTAEAIFTYLRDTYRIPASVEELVHHKTERYLALIKDHLKPFPEVLEFVRMKTYPENFRKALVTSSNRRVQTAVIETLGIAKCFDVVVTGDDVKKGKPDPEPYLFACQKLDVDPSDTVVFEDSVAGVLSARDAGCRVVGLMTSVSERDLLAAGASIAIPLSKYKANMVADTVTFLLRNAHKLSRVS